MPCVKQSGQVQFASFFFRNFLNDSYLTTTWDPEACLETGLFQSVMSSYWEQIRMSTLPVSKPILQVSFLPHL